MVCYARLSPSSRLSPGIVQEPLLFFITRLALLDYPTLFIRTKSKIIRNENTLLASSYFSLTQALFMNGRKFQLVFTIVDWDLY